METKILHDMDLRVESHNDKQYILSQSMGVLIRNSRDVLDLLAFSSEHRTNLFILKETNLDPAFYDLKTGLAGEVLQKFSNYQARAAIIGSFHLVQSKRFQEFMYESNRGNRLRFTGDRNEALAWLCDKVGR